MRECSMPKKIAKKAEPTPVKKTAGKGVKPKVSPRAKIDRSMAVVLQATGLGLLKPIRPSRKTAVEPKPKSR